MKEKIQVINNTLLEHKTVEERKAYLENLGQEYQDLLAAEDVLLDERDYTFYSIIKIAGREWLGENIRYQTDKGSHAYDDNPANVLTHGRLYSKEAAQKACPEGWVVPDNEAWMGLLKSLGGFYDCYYDDHVGTDPESVNPKLLASGSSGMDLSLGGKLVGSRFQDLGSDGCYWTNSPCFVEDDGSIVYISNEYGDATINSHEDDYCAFSLRAVRANNRDWVAAQNKRLLQLDLDARKAHVEGLGSVVEEKIAAKEILLDERDYTFYSIKKIGNQYWLGENLRFEHENSAVYDHKTDAAFIARYGRLYSPLVLNQICPKGCNIPTLKDYETLFNHFKLGASLSDSEQSIENASKGANLTRRGDSGFNAAYTGSKDAKGSSFGEWGSIGFHWCSDREWDWGCYFYVAFNNSDGAYAYYDEHHSPIMASCRVILEG